MKEEVGKARLELIKREREKIDAVYDPEVEQQATNTYHDSRALRATSTLSMPDRGHGNKDGNQNSMGYAARPSTDTDSDNGLVGRLGGAVVESVSQEDDSFVGRE